MIFSENDSSQLKASIYLYNYLYLEQVSPFVAGWGKGSLDMNVKAHLVNDCIRKYQEIQSLFGAKCENVQLCFTPPSAHSFYVIIH